MGESVVKPDYNLSTRRRIQLAEATKSAYPHKFQPYNSDETDLGPTYPGNFHKGLAHDPVTGELSNPEDYQQLLKALRTGKQSDFDAIPLYTGGPWAPRKLVDPQAARLAVLNGRPPASFQIPAPPSITSDEAAVEFAELKWQAQFRDKPFINWANLSSYGLDADADKLINILSIPALHDAYKGPSKNALVPRVLVRGNGAGELYGPYVSQYLLQPFMRGSMPVTQRYLVDVAGSDFATTKQDLIDLQNGKILGPNPPTTLAYVYNGRSLASIVHRDAPVDFGTCALNLLTTLKCPPNPTLPTFAKEATFLTFGGDAEKGHLLSLAVNAALENAWNYKYNVGRKVRPEAFSILADNALTNNKYGISSALLNLVPTYWPNLVLSQGFAEASPTHCSFPSGHSSALGASITLLKILFNGQTKWTDLNGHTATIVQADATGSTLVPYVGSDTNLVTVNSELNKLGYNVSMGRTFAGIHTRSESHAGILLGEQVAIAIMRERLASYNNGNYRIEIQGYLGNPIVIEPLAKFSPTNTNPCAC